MNSFVVAFAIATIRVHKVGKISARESLKGLRFYVFRLNDRLRLGPKDLRLWR